MTFEKFMAGLGIASVICLITAALLMFIAAAGLKAIAAIIGFFILAYVIGSCFD